MDLDRHPSNLNEQCQDLERSVEAATRECAGETTSLLALLRTLEKLHRQIFNDHFVPNLPNSRQPLYALLREMEAEGGWPYIPKMRIYELLDYLNAQDAAEAAEAAKSAKSAKSEADAAADTENAPDDKA